MASDLESAIHTTVEGMPPRCREVFLLLRTQALTYAEVAVILGISPKTVEIHMSRALAILRARLGPWLSG
jgi:RNA polymerase sigma-70 factor (ECF subfamily)